MAETSDNIVLIGKKPIMKYVVAMITLFNEGKNKVVVKARGRAISRAVDSVELLRHAFIKEAEIGNVTIGTEKITRMEGQEVNVSTIEITLLKSKKEK